MKPGNTVRWKKYTGILLLGFVSLWGLGLSWPGRELLNSARSFVHYYHELEKSGVPTGFWERVVFSLVLASADSPGPDRSNATTRSSS